MTLPFAVAAQRLELSGGDGELRQDRGRSDGDVVGAENKFDIAGFEFEAKDGTFVSGEVGFGYTLGRDREKARMIALCDALLQSNAAADAVEAKVIAPLRAAMSDRRGRKAAEAAATKVDFYTMVRGEG